MTSDISALMDGELDPDEAGHILRDMKQDAGLRETWSAYHLIGDSLRERGHLATDIRGKVAHRLAGEPTVLAPHLRKPEKKRFPALALAASVSAFGFVGLLAFQMVKLNSLPGAAMVAAAPQAVGQPHPLQLAAATSPAAPSLAAKESTAKEPATIKFSTAASNPYLLAHQEFSPSYDMTGMPAYVRTVTETEPDGSQ